MHRFLGIVYVLIMIVSSEARAGVIAYSSQTTFEAEGNISSRLDFDSYGTGANYISAPTGSLDFQTLPNTVIIGTGVPAYATVRAVSVGSTFGAQTIGVDSTSTHYSMLAFQMGYINPFNHAGSGGIYLTTNLAAYNMGNYGGTSASVGLDFVGFTTTDSAEYFTGFTVSPNYDSTGGSPGLTAFELGQVTSAGTASVPEPTSLSIFSIGAIGFVLRRFRRNK